MDHRNQESSSGTGDDPPIEDAWSFTSALFKNSSRSGQPSNRARGYGQSTSEPSGRPRRCCLRRVRGGDIAEGAVRGQAHVRVHLELRQCRLQFVCVRPCGDEVVHCDAGHAAADNTCWSRRWPPSSGSSPANSGAQGTHAHARTDEMNTRIVLPTAAAFSVLSHYLSQVHTRA